MAQNCVHVTNNGLGVVGLQVSDDQNFLRNFTVAVQYRHVGFHSGNGLFYGTDQGFRGFLLNRTQVITQIDLFLKGFHFEL